MKNAFLIDANSLIHRAYHALPPLTDKDNNPTGALYGLTSVLIKIFSQKDPDYVVACFDRPEPTFRKKRFEDYKAHRPKADSELVEQLIKAPDVFKAFGIPVVDKAGYEADDIVGTLSHTIAHNHKDIRVIILTGDLDALQLVEDGKIVVETFKKGVSETIEYNERGVQEKLGVLPKQVVEYKSLVGDTSDNIPGVPGIGPKTASDILNTYPDVATFLEKGSEHKKFELINQHKKDVVLSKELATIITNAPITFDIKEAVFSPDQKKVMAMFDIYNFSSLEKRLSSLFPNQPPQPQKEEGEDNNPKNHALPSNTIILDPTLTTPSKKEYLSEKEKVGFGLKEVYKQYPFSPPYFDIQIGLQLLGNKCQSKEACQKELGWNQQDLPTFYANAFEYASKHIEKEGVKKVLHDIELPLIPVLAAMEQRGMYIDTTQLSLVQEQISTQVEEKKKEILSSIGKDINLNSPKQLLEYFKKDLGLSITSTAAEKLEKEQDQHPVIKDILSYRELFKLKTTYIDAYQKLVDHNRIHPTFLQLGASTGRLSCQNPNLQNIPHESEWAQDIRKIFAAPKEHTLVSFDYSQIELRVLAWLSDDAGMKEAFNNNRDIHALTAQKVFHTKDISPAQRRLAKTLNFGVVYGMGPRAFAQQSGLSQKEAKEFISTYFEQFSSVKEWQEQLLTQARRDGRVSNVHGRFRKLPELHSSKSWIAAEAERMAVNMPTQGTAADIMKLAMIKVHHHIQQHYKNVVYITSTIHDELICEIHESCDKKEVIENIRKIMEGVITMSVPLKVDVAEGPSWGELKKVQN
jgi:DNA polymerase-1